MWKWLWVGVVAGVVALPFLFRRTAGVRAWRGGEEVLTIITPMNEAIRHEYGVAFSRWHEARYGAPVKIDWRNIGGSSEIMRYLRGEYIAAFRAWWIGGGHRWRSDGGEIILDGGMDIGRRPAGVGEGDWGERVRMWRGFRETDDPAAFTSKLDMFFGGGAYDGEKATRQGLVVPMWGEGEIPGGLLRDEATGAELIPEGMSGERWRTATFYGTTLSTFGICFNRDRMAACGIKEEPKRWRDLADPRWLGTLGLADPTKSGSIAKAFETIVHVECARAVAAAGYGEGEVERYEEAIKAAGLGPGEVPEGVPAGYQAAVEAGWTNGVRLVQRITANARYFTDSASKVPLDVGSGNAAAGLCIDFYGRFEAATAGGGRMGYITPRGESGVSADPISLLRGAPHKELARRFARFLLSEEGQALWCYRAGAPGGPETYALHRLPIRRDFYPGGGGRFQAGYERHRGQTTWDLGAPSEDAYLLAREYRYHARWTGGHYGLLRELVRAMSLDAGIELRRAWGAIVGAGGPEVAVEAVAAMEAMPMEPEPLTWRSGLGMLGRHDREELLRVWTGHFRRQYKAAEGLAGGGGGGGGGVGSD